MKEERYTLILNNLNKLEGLSQSLGQQTDIYPSIPEGSSRKDLETWESSESYSGESL